MTFQNPNFDKPLSAIENKEASEQQKSIIERINSLNRQIEALRLAIDAYTVANLKNAHEELESLKKEKKDLQDGLAEKDSQTANPEDIKTTE